MSILSDIKDDKTIEDEEKDQIFNKSFIIDSGLYLAKITTAYTLKSPKGATGIAFNFALPDNKQFKKTIYITSGDAKGNVNFYLDKDKNKRYLPNYLLINGLIKLLLGKSISDLETEERVINVYNNDPNIKKEIPTTVDMITELLDHEVYIGVQRQIVDAKKLVNNKYVLTGQTKETSEIDKFFRAPDKYTNAEILAEATEATFYKEWERANTGNIIDKSSDKKTANTSPKSTATSDKSTDAPVGSLFNKS